MTKFASLKKTHAKIIILKRNLKLNDLRFLYYIAKACLDLSGLYRLIFQSLYHTSLIFPKREIDEIINFSKLSQVVHKKICRIFSTFWHPIFKRGKRNEAIGHMKHAAVYDRHSCTLHWVS